VVGLCQAFMAMILLLLFYSNFRHNTRSEDVCGRKGRFGYFLYSSLSTGLRWLVSPLVLEGCTPMSDPDPDIDKFCSME
jgi:hypothetical protein